MKTPSPDFNARLLKIAGEKPLLIAKIFYGPGVDDYFLASTERLQIESDIYEPWVQSFGPIRIGIDEKTYFAPANTVSIVLVRNSTTANLLNANVKQKKVFLWQWFESLSYYSDRLSRGTYVIDKISDISLSSFTLECKSDESRFIDIPVELINSADYPYMLSENKDIPWPLVLGELLNPTGSQNRYLDAYTTNVGISHCVDKSGLKYLSYRHASIRPQSGLGVRAYEYIAGAGGGLFATIEEYPETAIWDEEIGDFYRLVKLKPYDSANRGNSRAIRLLPTKATQYNNVPTWHNACDLNPNTTANLSAPLGYNPLALGFDKTVGIGEYKFLSYSYFTLKAALNLISVSQSVLIGIYYDANYVSQTFTTTGYHITTVYWSDSYYPLDLSRLHIEASVPAGHTAQIDGFHVWIQFWSKTDPIEIKRKPLPKRRRREEMTTSMIKEGTQTETKLANIFVEGRGPADQSGQNWPHWHPLSILYFLLNKMLLIPTSEINVSQWHEVYNSMGTSWIFAKSIYERVNAFDLLTTCLSECQLKMWRDDYNKFRVFRNNRVGANMSFSDKQSSIYLLQNFKWGYTDEFYNKFEMKYKWTPGRNDFQELYQKNKDNDTELNTSYVNYGNTEVSYPFADVEWIRQSSVMDLLYAELKKYWKQLKIWIEFDTSLIGSLLELGDTVYVDHSAQTWSSTSKGFQVCEIEQDGNKVHIKAIEIIP